MKKDLVCSCPGKKIPVDLSRTPQWWKKTGRKCPECGEDYIVQNAVPK